MYALLHCKSVYSLGDGTASVPELVERAARLGYRALALTDVESLAGQIELHKQPVDVNALITNMSDLLNQSLGPAITLKIDLQPDIHAAISDPNQLELAILNQADRFTLVIDVIDRVPGLAARAAHLKEQMKNEIILNLAYAHEHGTDRPEIENWVWPY